MIQYVSTKGTAPPVSFDQAVLEGFAPDGGLYVPKRIPKIPVSTLKNWKGLDYPALAFEILSLFIHDTVIPRDDLKRLIDKSFEPFEHPELMPLVPLVSDENSGHTIYSMELFHGPTQSFKDIAMGFLMNTVDYLLERRNSRLSIILATTGDTGPAAAFAANGKSCIDCWPLYPEGMISREQERQMTTLAAPNIHPVSVRNCPDGGDDLDLVVAKMFATPGQKEALNLSSVNSINWCRVMAQSVHYVYGYLKVCDTVGDPVHFCVPSGAFGNMFAGFLAREMGAPISCFICANNTNQTLHQVFSTGVFKKEDLCPTLSSAIDIVVPYNFWRFLYFIGGEDGKKLAGWMTDFETQGEVRFDRQMHARIRQGYTSCSVSDKLTLETIRHFWNHQGYLLDPHGAVAVAAALETAREGGIDSGAGQPLVCLTTAHPAKFPDVIKKALNAENGLPRAACHDTIEQARRLDESFQRCDISELERFLIRDIENHL